MTAIKTKAINHLKLENDIIVCISNIGPRFKQPVSEKQSHESH